MAGAVKLLFDAPPSGELARASVPGLVTGVVMGAERDGRPVVSWEGSSGPRAAETVWFSTPPDWPACCGVHVVLGFAGGDQTRPLILGFIDPPTFVAPSSKEPGDTKKPEVLHLESEQELILECGKAKIALRADGKVTILGGYVVSQSSGVNKIRGGSVQIN